ncbi:MAG: HAD-IA family hydrolase [Prevotellaceae bacterium]|nr:HAD-IA family hydrolase [Prevotella sp.]MDD7257695.1 HAD-IA family hydrolase [Prevotellaceae bacterium]MDY6130736.1 HAD-IA family hydrolase [Prevotella sp.]
MFEKEIKEYIESNGFGAFCPKAALFDMDGVLYNSMPNQVRAWLPTMQKHGIAMTENDVYRFEGMRGVETIKMLAYQQWDRHISDEEAENIYAEKSHLFATFPKAVKIRGVEELMRKMKADGLMIVVVTGSGQQSLLDKLEDDFGGLIHGHLVVSSFDVTRGKPNPEPYLRGLQKAGVQPWEAIVVENAPLGVRAGVAANIFTVAVNSGPLPNSVLAKEGANLVFSKMTELCDAWNDFHRLP